MLRLRFDSLSVGATPIEVRPNGWRVYRGVASYGDVVLDYGPLDPGGARSEFVPAATALDPETVRLTEGIPFTVMHPGDLLNADAEDDVREHSEGMVLKAVADWKSSPPSLVVDVIVHTKSAQDAIESGRVRELSLGYSCDDEEADGEHDGRAYQVVQRRRRPNHLSGVPRARSRTSDGRAARLDGDTGGHGPVVLPDLGTMTRASSGAHYAHLDAGAPMEDDETQDPATAPRTDADPEVTATDAPVEVVADPAAALAAFSPEDAEVLKTLSPEGLALLAKAMKQVEAGAVEGAVLEGVDPAVALAEAEENDDAKPAPAAAAPGGAPDLEAMGKMIADMQKQFDELRKGNPAARSDAQVQAEKHRLVPAVHKPTEDAVARQARLDAEKRRKDDDAFVATIRKQVGSKARLDSASDAAREALASIGHQTPEVLDVARRAWNDRRLDDLAQLAATADRKRRDGILDSQGATISAVASVESDYLAQQVRDFLPPKSAVSGA